MNANNLILRNNTGNKSKFNLIEGFAVRTKLFKDIFSEISLSSLDRPEQSYLIIGQRGSGKTTLLYRLKYAIEDDPDLQNWAIPIMFTEEQYGITELENLWEYIGDYLEEEKDYRGLVKEINSKYQKEGYYEEQANEILQAWLKKNNKRVILFIENINSFFKKIGDKGQQRLREVLTTSPYFVIIGSATTYFDGIIDYSKPFYDFFKTIQLEGLTKEETEKMLLKIAEQHQSLREIKRIIKQFPERVESLRRLTAGIPRTISYLFQIFMDNENGKAIKDLYQLLDNLSLLYKAELDQLSVQQQKIVDAIAKKWDYISAKEIAIKTRFDSKHISSILNQLEKNQIIEIIPTSSKNHLYGIKDRFLNIWYLMRFGKKTEKEKVIWLVRFYDVWCDKTELTKKISDHIKSLKKGQYDEFAAISMGNTFLACENIPLDLKYNLYETTKSVLPKSLIKSVAISDTEFYNIIKQFLKTKEYDKALDALNEITIQDKNYYLYSSLIYSKKGDHLESSKALEKVYSIDNDGDIALQIGVLNERFVGDYDKAIAYYELALNKKIFQASHRLGHVYWEHFSNPIKSEEYFRLAIDNGIDSAIQCLAKMLSKNNKNFEAEQLFRKAKEIKLKGASNNLGLHYAQNKDFKSAEIEFKEAIKDGDSQAIANYGILQINREKPNLQLAKIYFEKLTKVNKPMGHYLLGRLYSKELKDKINGEKHLLIADAEGHAEATHELAHFYTRNKEYDKAEKFYIKSIAMGQNYAILCLMNSHFTNNRNNRKAFLLNYLEQNISIIENLKPHGMIFYSLILLWNNKIEQSIENLKKHYSIISQGIKSNDEIAISDMVEILVDYFILLISKGQYNAALMLFEENTGSEFSFKDILKPVYIALKQLPNVESKKVKISSEYKETVEEIINKINIFKTTYK